ncbi:putative molybdenum carrier protein [Ruegeria sp. A3M17]|uniref:putative molybdenum carrier protein n=1 Tax=Ruegeria sp. A3M17 TaxID=2267229 RepID=UPI000DE84B9E|nr:putative molybdenum carrier protein [Ruegeria sp. A3M17]RBW62096.1 molybdenum cofactor carrier [Ruegeria sp. A3M17]
MKIITGGQTGVDLAAFQFALENDIAYGGWVPKSRLNEAGRIPDRFCGLSETRSEDVAERTRMNVLSCDALLVFVDGTTSPGTQLTIDFAQEIGKPYLVVDLGQGFEACARQVKQWVMARPNAVLNIAGPRESEAPQIGAKVTAILRQSISPQSPEA